MCMPLKQHDNQHAHGFGKDIKGRAIWVSVPKPQDGRKKERKKKRERKKIMKNITYLTVNHKYYKRLCEDSKVIGYNECTVEWSH